MSGEHLIILDLEVWVQAVRSVAGFEFSAHPLANASVKITSSSAPQKL